MGACCTSTKVMATWLLASWVAPERDSSSLPQPARAPSTGLTPMTAALSCFPASSPSQKCPHLCHVCLELGQREASVHNVLHQDDMAPLQPQRNRRREGWDGER